MDNWKITPLVEQTVEGYVTRLSAEPMIAEVGEEVRKLVEELTLKMALNEMEYALMLTPARTVKYLGELCERELDRRHKEYKELEDEK